jgi:tetratricopeptide (TPR) repeat protein
MVHASFVPLMIDVDKDRDTAQKYGVRAMPTFVILSSEGEEEMRQRGAPFRTPEDARDWFGRILGGLDNVTAHEEAYAENGDSLEHGMRLAGTYNDLGRGKDALEIYEKFEDQLDPEAENYVDIRLAHADALTSTITRENRAEVAPRLAKIYESVVPQLIEAKDERAIEPGMMVARIKAMVGNDPAAGREGMLKLAEVFPESSHIWEMRTHAALFAQRAGDSDTAKAEYQAIIKDAEEAEADDKQFVRIAKQLLAELEKPEEVEVEENEE